MKTIDEKKKRIVELGKELQELMYEIGMGRPKKGQYGCFDIWDKNGESKNSVQWIDSDNGFEIEF